MELERNNLNIVKIRLIIAKLKEGEPLNLIFINMNKSLVVSERLPFYEEIIYDEILELDLPSCFPFEQLFSAIVEQELN